MMAFRAGVLAATTAIGLVSSAMAGTSAPIADLAVAGEIHGSDGRFDYATVDPAAHRLYIARGDGVMSVDLGTGKVTPTLVPGAIVHAVVALPGGRLLSTNGGSNTATLSDAQGRPIVKDIPTGKKPDAALFDPKSGLVFVMDGDDGDVTLVDPKTGASPGRIAVGGTLEFAVADAGGHVYVNIEDKAEIAVIDTAARKVTQRFALPGCDEPSGLALDPEHHVLLSVCRNEKAVAVNARDGAVLATLDIGKGPDAAIFDARRQSFFVPCGRDGTLVAITEADGKLAVARRIPTAAGARTGALDAATGRLYLPAVDTSPADHKPIAGTFRVLVVDARQP
jgi:DNA-binding beta-propeller fold protein YncE